MWPQVVTIFLASLMGSMHCVGMCGAFVALAIQSGNDRINVPRWKLQGAYHLGRWVTYSLLGTTAGALGQALNLAGKMAGWEKVAAVGAGGFMILFGVAAILRTWGVKVPPLITGNGGGSKILIRAYQSSQNMLPLPRAAMIGLLTTFLPCGWLWMFVVTAAATGGPWQGALVMTVFWVGTLPYLVGLGVVLGQLQKSLARHLPLITAVVMIIIGMLTMMKRLTITPQALADNSGITSTEEMELPACCQPTKPTVKTPVEK